MRILDDQLISRIRKVTLAALKESKMVTGLWATKDSAGNWLVACRTCVMAWSSEEVDDTSTKLDKLIMDGLEESILERFEDNEWFSVLVDIPRLVRAHRSPLHTKTGTAIEYQNSWSRKAVVQKAYYRTEYLQLAEEISDSGDLKYAVLPRGKNGDRDEQVILVIYDGKKPFMVLSNTLPMEAETDDAEEDPCSTAD